MKQTGWMHTTTAADFIDEFVEDVVRDNGELKYRYGEGNDAHWMWHRSL